ncbi:MAG: alanine--glyoxylate aminotransferase family protein [Firmicutes bacterium]|nr:alanine--glyoxylate aminotransferase family protein [Bacillota bacterium]
MSRRKYLQIPGPTNIPDRVLRSLAQPIISHRGPEFEQLVADCIEGLKKVYRTENDILILPSSGSGALESAIVNLFSPGDTIAAASLGVFSERVALIAERHGLNVIRITKEWGQAIKPPEIAQVLADDRGHKIKAVCLPQNETTSGVANDLKAISQTIKETGHPALIMVDAVSSLACMPLETDAWGIDIVVSGSQKGLMLPPGLGIVSVSPKAWTLIEQSTMPKWYWDYQIIKDRLKTNQFPYTPPTSIFFGLKEALAIIEEEGLENVFARHKQIAEAVRNSSKAMGLELFAEQGYESNSVTVICLPQNVKYEDLERLLYEKYGLVIGGGLQKLQGQIFRIGHLGLIHNTDVYAIMCAVEAALVELGYQVELGTAARAISETFLPI